MILYITDRNIRVYNADNQISYNSDYIAEFRFDDEWNGKVKTARFIQNGEYFDIVLADDRCEIPPLKTGFVRVGVFTDSMTSTYVDVYYKTSIKDGTGNPAEPPEDVYAQLTELVESGILKGDDGLTPYVGSNNNWWIGDIDTGVLARGTDGEDGYTPVKGVDYFTEEEVQQIQNEVSGGAIGDFKAVVDEKTATFNTNAENTLTNYNANAQEKFDTYNANADNKFETYNTNAETKFSEYNTNAEAKLSEYNKNDLDKTTLYNTNADSKFTTYNENAETKFSEYTSNAETKLSEYNQNDSDKTALYNANAENKFSAYDSNAWAKLDLYNQNDSKKMEAYNSNAEQKQEAYNSNHTTKLTTYDTNAEQHTTDYNANASEKLTTYNANAEQHTTDYNRNAEVKLEAYNQNHTEKVAEYNQNAEIKKAEFDANVGEQIAEKANIDGYYEEMTVGDAEQLISTQFVEDNKPYLFRPTGGSSDVGNRAYLDKIIGGTVAWNQLIRAMRGSGSEKGLTFTRNADGSLNISGTIAEEFSYNYVPFTFTGIKFKRDGRKYLLMLNKPIPYAFGVSGYGATISANSVGGMWSNNAGTDWVNGLNFRANVGTTIDIQNLRAMVFDITQMFGSTIADYIYSLEQSQAGAGVAWFKKLFPKDYYPYNAGELLSVEGLQSHDTVGFNQWDEALESVGLNAETGLPFADTRWFGTKNFIPIFPSTAYYYKIPTRATYGRLCFYDVDKNFISYRGTSAVMNNIFITPQNAHYMKFTLTKSEYGTTYKNDICINLSDPSRNGEYEPYEKHSYPLDNSLTLRGIPKLDASNNLYYDGDEYTSDGKVKRKYGIVDLGTLDWRLDGSAYTFGKKTWLPDRDNFGAIIVGYDFVKSSTDATNLDKVYKTIRFDAGHGAIYIKDKSYADATSFKQAMSGVMLVYELATPTAETAEPFQHIQIVDDFGTEEFVNTGIVPVGHKTRYPANLRDKLQHLPDLASADGTYLIKQSGKQMSLVHMPAVFHDTPTEDGTYTLKAVITGGVATLQWVAE